MERLAALTGFCIDLIEVLQLQAKQLERITNHLDQQTVRMRPSNLMPTVVSELSALHQRAKELEREMNFMLNAQVEGPAL